VTSFKMYVAINQILDKIKKWQRKHGHTSQSAE
jgi:ribosome-associated translation inhibitor RaiA